MTLRRNAFRDFQIELKRCKAIQRNVHLIDLVESFPATVFSSMSLVLNLHFYQDPYSNEYLLSTEEYMYLHAKSDSIQPWTGPWKFTKRLLGSQIDWVRPNIVAIQIQLFLTLWALESRKKLVHAWFCISSTCSAAFPSRGGRTFEDADYASLGNQGRGRNNDRPSQGQPIRVFRIDDSPSFLSRHSLDGPASHRFDY